MASTNKTTNLQLSQFLGTDKPAWLTDYNSDMQKIDDGYKKQADDITGLDSRTTDLESGLTNSDTNIAVIQSDIQSLKDEDIIIKRDINTLSTNYDVIHHEVAVNAQELSDTKDDITAYKSKNRFNNISLSNYKNADLITGNDYSRVQVNEAAGLIIIHIDCYGVNLPEQSGTGNLLYDLNAALGFNHWADSILALCVTSDGNKTFIVDSGNGVRAFNNEVITNGHILCEMATPII